MGRKKKSSKHKHSYLEIGETFKNLRLDRGLTLQQVSDFVGYHHTTRLSAVENGTSLPQEKELKKLCELFNLPIQETMVKVALAIYQD